MKADAAVANTAWLTASLPEWVRYRRARAGVEATQRRLLSDYLRNNAGTAFGQTHRFDRIGDWETYASRVPVRAYDELQPWIGQIASGSVNVLTRERVELLEPSSGSSGPEKWIPYTRSLRAEFRRAVAVWIADLFARQPGLMGGRAYWSLTPQPSRIRRAETPVPIGFDDDSAYLGGITQGLIERTLAMPQQIRRVTDMETFWRVTLLALLKCRDLRLISVWHPSYLMLLLQRLRSAWPDLLEDLGTGFSLSAPALDIGASPARARQLERIGPERPAAIWPSLRLISAWGDAHATSCLDDVRAAFPGVGVQPKGLIATEAFVTLALGDRKPLAIRSHFFEFLDDDGVAHPPWSVRRGRAYSLVVTTGGGLYRYRLGDRVAVTGFYGDIPELRFVGKEDNVSDFRGEKLTETFVAAALETVFSRHRITPQFAMMALDPSGKVPGYALYVQSNAPLPERLAGALDAELKRNPHYDLCLRLGQLAPLRVVPIAAGAYEIYSQALTEQGMRLGDIKPTPLSRYDGWSRHFRGTPRV